MGRDQQEAQLKSELEETKSKLSEVEHQMKDIIEVKQQLQVQNLDLLAEVDSLKIEQETLSEKLSENQQLSTSKYNLVLR